MTDTAATMFPPPLPASSPLGDECVVYNPLWFVGVLLDAVATLAGTGGKQLLRYAVIKKNPWYYPLGLVCTAVIDPAFDISAYSFAAQSIISPMAGMVVVWNIVIAPFTLGEALTRTRIWGAFLIILGTFFVGLAGNHEDTKRSVDDYLELFSRFEAVAYYLLFTVWSSVCCYYWRHGSPFVSGFYVGALGGSLAGNMFTTKAVVEMLKCVFTGDQSDPCDQTSCSFNPFFTIWPYFFILVSLTLACVSLWLLAVGLRSFEALYMITVFEGFMIISGSISGNVVMNEKEGVPTFRLWIYALAIIIILIGLVILCRGESADPNGRLLTRTSHVAGEVEAMHMPNDAEIEAASVQVRCTGSDNGHSEGNPHSPGE